LCYCVQILLLTCLLALAFAVEDKAETDLSTNVEVPPDQDAAEWNYRTYYGHYYNPYGYYGRGYWRGKRSVDEKKSEVEAATTADQDVNEWYGRRYYGYPYGYRHHYGHWRGRRDANDADQKTEENHYPGWGYNRGYYYGGYPYRHHSYYYGRHYPSSYSYSYRH
jgi:hypothetical protein